MPTTAPSPSAAPAAVTGVQLMQGIGVVPAKAFWPDAWSQVLKRPAAVCGLVWISIVAFFAVFSPVLANGHPLVVRHLDASGAVTRTSYPLFDFLSALDVILLILGLVGIPLALLLPVSTRARRFKWLASTFVIALVTIVAAALIQGAMNAPEASPSLRALRTAAYGPYAAAAFGLALAAFVTLALPIGVPRSRRLIALLVGGIAGVACVAATWNRPALESFDYQRRAVAGEISATYTLVPFGPQQRFSELSRQPPNTTLGEGLGLAPDQPGARHRFVLGTDAFGSDVLAQLLHACRLSISIGLVSTGIALTIGVTLGALMGYFGGWVDLVLFRVVEIFMAVPVLFLLIVAVAVIKPEFRTTYTMMAIVGCFSWTGMARFTRSEFLKLRNQDFVQSAKAVGLPLRSVLFKHMLPNGVAPVLVESSFAIAAAITVEAVLSYLNLGPIDQASWGKLLASAVSSEGEFKWWLAVFPGLAIFLTVLSYNLVGEALRDAIDPKLKKARV
jgi:peptide/nickel transport system permease protein